MARTFTTVAFILPRLILFVRLVCFIHPGHEKLETLQHFYFWSVRVPIFIKNNKIKLYSVSFL